MAEDSQSNPDNSTEAKKKGAPRAAFPRLTLSKVLPLAKQVYELGEGDPVPRLVVFDRLGKSSESGPSRMLVTTSSAYGLTTGGYQAERLGITDRGRGIVNAGNNEVARANAVRILLANDLFAQFYAKYQNKGVPQEPVAIDFLKQAGGLPDSDAKAAYEVFIANLNDYGFIREMSGRPTIISQDLMDLQIPDESTDDPGNQQTGTANSNDGQNEAHNRSDRKPFNSKVILPQFNFNIQVQLPESATAEIYDAIFKSMAEHLLKS